MTVANAPADNKTAPVMDIILVRQDILIMYMILPRITELLPLPSCPPMCFDSFLRKGILLGGEVKFLEKLSVKNTDL